MQKFDVLTGVAAPLPILNIDTDMIIPKQYLKTIKRTGLGKGLFSEMRYREDGSENPDFVLNKDAWRKAEILVAGDNFGCGSSREHAPWALLDYGFKAVISTEIADIFTSNALKNGLLPIVVSQAVWDDLASQPDQPVTINLQANEIRRGNAQPVPFGVESFARQCLLDGVDTLGWLQSNLPEIEAYERSRETVR